MELSGDDSILELTQAKEMHKSAVNRAKIEKQKNLTTDKHG
jgi:hypothetical protein